MSKNNDISIRIDLLDDLGKTIKSLVLDSDDLIVGGAGNLDVYEIIVRVLLNSGINFTTVITE